MMAPAPATQTYRLQVDGRHIGRKFEDDPIGTRSAVAFQYCPPEGTVPGVACCGGSKYIGSGLIEMGLHTVGLVGLDK